MPFLVVGLAADRVRGTLGVFRRHGGALTLASSAVLLAFGFLLLTDQLTWLTVRLTDALDGSPFEWAVRLG